MNTAKFAQDSFDVQSTYGEKLIDVENILFHRPVSTRLLIQMRTSTWIIAPTAIAFFLTNFTEAQLKVYTQECISKADFSSCEQFNSCCDFRCSRAQQKRSTCTINGTGINAIQTECVCSKPLQLIEVSQSRKTRHSRLDLIAGILFIFVLDMLLLSFTF
uniref:Transmembrane protein n=1 Tax=Caenorhabditis japonica TaxID=281687 RepID=A0A8R1E9C1_CAEJA